MLGFSKERQLIQEAYTRLIAPNANMPILAFQDLGFQTK